MATPQKTDPTTIFTNMLNKMRHTMENSVDAVRKFITNSGKKSSSKSLYDEEEGKFYEGLRNFVNNVEKQRRTLQKEIDTLLQKALDSINGNVRGDGGATSEKVIISQPADESVRDLVALIRAKIAACKSAQELASLIGELQMLASQYPWLSGLCSALVREAQAKERQIEAEEQAAAAAIAANAMYDASAMHQHHGLLWQIEQQIEHILDKHMLHIHSAYREGGLEGLHKHLNSDLVKENPFKEGIFGHHKTIGDVIHALHELSDKKLYIDSLNRMKQMSDEIYARTDLSASQKDDELVRLAYNESRELTKKQLQNPQFSDIMQSPYAEAVVRGCCNGHVLCLIGDPRGQKQGVEKVVAQQDVEKKQQDSGKAQQDVEKKQQDVAEEHVRNKRRDIALSDKIGQFRTVFADEKLPVVNVTRSTGELVAGMRQSLGKKKKSDRINTTTKGV